MSLNGRTLLALYLSFSLLPLSLQLCNLDRTKDSANGKLDIEEEGVYILDCADPSLEYLSLYIECDLSADVAVYHLTGDVCLNATDFRDQTPICSCDFNDASCVEVDRIIEENDCIVFQCKNEQLECGVEVIADFRAKQVGCYYALYGSDDLAIDAGENSVLDCTKSNLASMVVDIDCHGDDEKFKVYHPSDCTQPISAFDYGDPICDVSDGCDAHGMEVCVKTVDVYDTDNSCIVVECVNDLLACDLNVNLHWNVDSDYEPNEVPTSGDFVCGGTYRGEDALEIEVGKQNGVLNNRKCVKSNLESVSFIVGCTKDSDEFKVYHLGGDQCDDPSTHVDPENMLCDWSTGCDEAGEECSIVDRDALDCTKDCIVIECTNEFFDCNLNTDVRWTQGYGNLTESDECYVAPEDEESPSESSSMRLFTFFPVPILLWAAVILF